MYSLLSRFVFNNKTFSRLTFGGFLIKILQSGQNNGYEREKFVLSSRRIDCTKKTFYVARHGEGTALLFYDFSFLFFANNEGIIESRLCGEKKKK